MMQLQETLVEPRVSRKTNQDICLTFRVVVYLIDGAYEKFVCILLRVAC